MKTIAKNSGPLKEPIKAEDVCEDGKAVVFGYASGHAGKIPRSHLGTFLRIRHNIVTSRKSRYPKHWHCSLAFSLSFE